MSENIIPQPDENAPDEVEELVEELEVHSVDAPIDDPADTNGCATNTCHACSGTC